MKLHLGCGYKYLRGWIDIDGPKDEFCYDDLNPELKTLTNLKIQSMIFFGRSRF
jgi:hypothetical protein